MESNREIKKIDRQYKNIGLLSLGLAIFAIVLTLIYFFTSSWGKGIQYKWIMSALPVLLVLGVISGLAGALKSEKFERFSAIGLILNVIGLIPFILVWADH